MEQLNKLIKIQYFAPHLYENILHRLEDQQIDLESVSRKNIAGVDEFHVRGAEVTRELAVETGLHRAKVLDVGCGLGGPARMLAEEFECHVTGIDMSGEFIRTARNLSKLVGLSDKTVFKHADALHLPFENGSFDVVWTQHVQMNVSNKSRFYSEIERVLTPEGMFIYYDIFKKNQGEVIHPVPWADDASLTFLQTPSAMAAILENLGMTSGITTDQTQKGISFLMGLFERIRQNGPPKIGLNVLMGSSTIDKLKNVLIGFNESQIVLQSGVFLR